MGPVTVEAAAVVVVDVAPLIVVFVAVAVVVVLLKCVMVDSDILCVGALLLRVVDE